MKDILFMNTKLKCVLTEGTFFPDPLSFTAHDII